MRKKLTPLQRVSIVERGTAFTNLEEEIGAGFLAMNFLRSKNDTHLLKLLSVYSASAAKYLTSESEGKVAAKKYFDSATKTLFRYAHKVRAFKDTQVFAGALLQSLEYLIANPDGELREIAIKLIQELDGNPIPMGAPSSFSNSFSPILNVVLVLLILKLVTGRSVQ